MCRCWLLLRKDIIYVTLESPSNLPRKALAPPYSDFLNKHCLAKCNHISQPFWACCPPPSLSFKITPIFQCLPVMVPQCASATSIRPVRPSLSMPVSTLVNFRGLLLKTGCDAAQPPVYAVSFGGLSLTQGKSPSMRARYQRL